MALLQIGKVQHLYIGDAAFSHTPITESSTTVPTFFSASDPFRTVIPTGGHTYV